MSSAQVHLGAHSGPSVGSEPDRRGNSRFPVREEVRYRVLNAKSLKLTGVGRTLDISSGGILFTTEEKLPIGKLVEVAVNWPVTLGGVCALRFVAVGRVVRAEHNKAAVRIDRYEFKTRRLDPEADANGHGAG
jgi:c-di-GMP-binding flagellar brake protein YcgR